MPTDVIVACDFPTKEDTLAFLDRFEGAARKPYLKVGMELYYAEGPAIVREIKARGHRLFLDLKLHDIPNTVRRTMQVLANLGVDMTNLHAGGGAEMMRAGLDGLTEGAAAAGVPQPKLIAVTMLTSTSETRMNEELRIPGALQDTVGAYAALAAQSGLDGVVCSPLEAGFVKERCGDAFLTVTPGVRFAGGDVGDQSRVTTPADAASLGSDYIVLGRPVTAAADPAAAYARALEEFLG